MKILLMLLALSSAALAVDFKEQAFDNAHTLFRSATNAAMYAEAAAQYEHLIHEEGIRNGDLFYTTGNSWFMAGDLGRAILNYRRAEHYLPRDKDVQYNLAAALQARADLIPEKDPHPFVANFLGWHIGTSTAFRGWSFALVWLVFWLAGSWSLRTDKKEARITAGIAGVLSAALLLSLVVDGVARHRRNPGVITAPETLARKGNGEMYSLAFMDPLHAGTEFHVLETRGDWLHVRLDDGQRCWISAQAAEPVKL